MTKTENTYDQIPYPSLSYRQSHPDRLATVAILMGMHPAPVDRCRVLELGCASGGNLAPMAYVLPNSEFVGIDNSQQQIAEGQREIESLGLKNIALKHLDILDMDGSLGQFDYIIAHGVFSWVPHAVQEKLLDACKDSLTPNGVAFVSYNAYPGWHMIGIIRDMMLYHTRDETDPQQQATMARQLLSFMAEALSDKEDAYGSFINMYANFLQGELRGDIDSGNSVLLHDELETHNQPLYFWQFAERAAQHGLQYLGDAEFRTMMGSNLKPDVNKTLAQMSKSVIDIEQYMDFVRNRTLRQTLLCHQGIEVRRKLSPEQLFTFRASSHAKTDAMRDQVDVHSTSIERFRSNDGATLATDHPVTKAAMLHLAEVWPRSVPFDELLETATSLLGVKAGHAERKDAQMLGTNLLKAYSYSSQLIELHTFEPHMVLDVSERPVASPTARLQAKKGKRVANLCHDRVSLDEVDRFLIQYLDGSHDQAALVQRLKEGPVADGRLVLEQEGEQVQKAEQLHQILVNGVHERLCWLAHAALLVA